MAVKKKDVKELNSHIADLSDYTKKNIILKLRHETLTANAPRNAEELYQACQVLFGVDIPYTACSEETNAPFQLVYDLYFDKMESGKALVMANRGGSKTFYSSMVTYLNNTFKPGYTCRHAGANRQQAGVASTYLRNFGLDEVLGQVFTEQPAKFGASWKNGSQFAIVTGSIAGVSGQHPSSFTMDEIEFWDVEALEQTWAVPVKIANYRPQWLAYSTRQRAASAMSWLVDNAKQRNVQIYQWTIFETMKRCPSCVCIEGGRVKSDPSSHCLLWERCKGLKGTKSTGWIDREAVIELTKGLGGPNSVASITQLFCEKPTTHGLVLHNFEHEYAPNGNYTRWEYNSALPYVIWFDPSEGKKSVMWFVQIFTNPQGEQTLRVFDELVIPNCASTSSAKKELVNYLNDKQYPNPLLIVVDPRRTDAVADLRNKDVCGLEFRAKTAPLDDQAGGNLVRLGCEAVRDAICNGNGKRTLLVNPETCPSFIEMVRQFAYKVDSNNVITSENPMEVKKDEFDATHYGVDWYNGEGKRVFGSGNSLIQSISL